MTDRLIKKLTTCTVMKTLNPMPGYVALQRLEDEPSKTASGILLASERKKNMSTGKIVSVHPEEPLLKVGDIVYYHVFSPKEIMLEGELLYIAKIDPDIIAIIQEEINP